jgi:hypothetical protein
LYAVGGQGAFNFYKKISNLKMRISTDGVQCLNHVERFCPKENKWTKVAPMSTRRLGVAVAVLGGFLYAIGEFFE